MECLPESKMLLLKACTAVVNDSLAMRTPTAIFREPQCHLLCSGVKTVSAVVLCVVLQIEKRLTDGTSGSDETR